MRRALAVVGPAAPAAAWERYADPGLWPTWSPQIRSVEASTPRLATGTTGVVHGVGGLELPFSVAWVDEARRAWAWEVEPVRAAGLVLPAPLRELGRMRLEHGLEPAEAGCLATLVVTGAAPVVAAYAPAAALALRRLVR